jgi:hypothetical protein
MGKVIDKGLMTKDDPGYSPGLIVGPVIVSRRPTKSGKQKSKPDTKLSRRPKVKLTIDDAREATGKE